jgi:hypothetical protein
VSGEPVLRLRSDDLAWREFAGEGVLLDLRTSMYLATNPSATVLWRQLDQGTTESAMTAALVDAFGIPAERAAADVRRFLAACRERDLLA